MLNSKYENVLDNDFKFVGCYLQKTANCLLSFEFCNTELSRFWTTIFTLKNKQKTNKQTSKQTKHPHTKKNKNKKQKQLSSADSNLSFLLRL